MNARFIQIRNYFFVLSFALQFFQLHAQALQMQPYFSFSQNTYPFALTTNGNGDLYFVDESTYPQQIKKVSTTGELSTIITDNLYIQNDSWNTPSNSSLTVDDLGNLYFINQNNSSQEIIKMEVNGTTSTFFSGNYYPKALTTDHLGNLYFIDQMNYPYTINKIDINGNVSNYLDNTNSTYQPTEIIIDLAGNLFFIDENSNNSIYKIDINGIVSLFYTNDNTHYIKSMTADGLGNLYILDQNNYPNQIYKIDSTGDVTLYAQNDNYVDDISRITSDENGNLFFLGYAAGSRKIFAVLNTNYVCATPSEPIVEDARICSNNSVSLNASGMGELKWYDAIGGNLVNVGSSFYTLPLTNTTSYFVQSEFCNFTSSFRELVVSVDAIPIVSIIGNASDIDVVTLTATGDATSFEWSGGKSPNTAKNYFNKSGMYSVTITNQFGCSATTSIQVTVTKVGVTPNGSLTNVFSEGLNSNGKINDVVYLNRFGKLNTSLVLDKKLNFKTFTSAASHPTNAAELSTYTDPINLFASGIQDASLLLNWQDWQTLNNAGVTIPNGGDRFSVELSGFFVPEETGVYTFTCEGDDAVDLFINGVNIANHYGGHGIDGLGTHKGTINVIQGTKYTFRARMQENGGGEGLKVYWRKPSDLSGWFIYPEEISSN